MSQSLLPRSSRKCVALDLGNLGFNSNFASCATQSSLSLSFLNYKMSPLPTTNLSPALSQGSREDETWDPFEECVAVTSRREPSRTAMGMDLERVINAAPSAEPGS